MLEQDHYQNITTLAALTHSTAGCRMAGPTWLTYPAVGCGGALLAPAWSPACIAEEMLGPAGCMKF